MAVDECDGAPSALYPKTATTSVASLLTVSAAAENGIRGRSNSSNRIIRSAVRSSQWSSNEASPPLSLGRRAGSMLSTATPVTASTTTTAAIMPTVRKLSECSISNYPFQFPASTLLPLHEPKMMRFNDDDDKIQSPSSRRGLSSQRVRVKSSSCGGGDGCMSTSSVVNYACESTAPAVSVMTMMHGSSSTTSSSTYTTFSKRSSFLATCSSSSAMTMMTSQSHASTSASSAFNGSSNTACHHFTKKLIIDPNDLSASVDMTNVGGRRLFDFTPTSAFKNDFAVPEGTTITPADDALLLTPSMRTQLSNSSSGVSSMDDATRRGSSISERGSLTYSCSGSGNANDDLNDLLDIIQRDHHHDSNDMLVDDDDTSVVKKRFWLGNAAQRGSSSGSCSSSALLVDVGGASTSDVFFSSNDELQYEPANRNGLVTVTSGTSESPRACWRSTTAAEDENETMLLAELQPAAATLSNSSTLQNFQQATTTFTASTDIAMDFISVEEHHASTDDERSTNGNDLISGAGVASSSASNTSMCMQMMSDNELMRMWIESLPPPHELPEPTLSPRLPVMLSAAVAVEQQQQILLSPAAAAKNISTISPDDVLSSHATRCNSHNSRHRRRYTLVLDLDETLVHAVTQPLADVSAPPDLTFPIEIVDPAYALPPPSPLLVSSSPAAAADNNASATIRANIMVYVRPYAVEFLRLMARHYEVVVFTASKSEYADRVIDYLCDEASTLTTTMSADDKNSDEDEEDADSTQSSTATSPRSNVSSSTASSGYASVESLNNSSVTTATAAVVADDAAVAAAITSGGGGVDEVDCAAALRCTESVLVDDVVPPISGNTSSSHAILNNCTMPRPSHAQTEHCVIEHRLYREHCVQLPYCPVYLKDLSRLGREIERTVIVDNQLLNFALQLDNGIAVRSWHGSPGHDSELKELAKFLLQMAEERVDDVRPYIKRSFGHLKP